MHAPCTIGARDTLNLTGTPVRVGPGHEHPCRSPAAPITHTHTHTHTHKAPNTHTHTHTKSLCETPLSCGAPAARLCNQPALSPILVGSRRFPPSPLPLRSPPLRSSPLRSSPLTLSALSPIPGGDPQVLRGRGPIAKFKRAAPRRALAHQPAHFQPERCGGAIRRRALQHQLAGVVLCGAVSSGLVVAVQLRALRCDQLSSAEQGVLSVNAVFPTAVIPGPELQGPAAVVKFDHRISVKMTNLCNAGVRARDCRLFD